MHASNIATCDRIVVWGQVEVFLIMQGNILNLAPHLQNFEHEY